MNGKKLIERYEGNLVSGMPKYVQLREALVMAIRDGYLPSGSKIPPEAKLAKLTRFSLGTVQKALKDLAENGHLTRRQGLGTFVADAATRMDVPWHCRFGGDREGEFLPVYPKVVSRQVAVFDTEWARMLSPVDGSLIQINRIMDIGREFMVYIKFFLNSSKFHGFLQKSVQELEQYNFKTILYKEFNIPINHVSYTLQIHKLEDQVCQAIKQPVGSMGAEYSVVASSGKANPIYYQQIFIPPNKRKLYISDSFNPPEYWT